jgi:transcriptional regulator with XRE-family HTH domain
MARRRKDLSAALVDRRLSVGLSQTSQSAVARLEAGEADIRLSTLERYAAAVGIELDWRLGERGR